MKYRTITGRPLRSARALFLAALLLIVTVACVVQPEPEADSTTSGEDFDSDGSASPAKIQPGEQHGIYTPDAKSSQPYRENRQEQAVVDGMVVTAQGRADSTILNRSLALEAEVPAAASFNGTCCPPGIRYPSEAIDRENYAPFDQNPVKLASQYPVSTFSIDVDTGAYSNVRRFINAGQLPPEDAVRVEELINYFSYDYAVPDDIKTPFSVTTEVAQAPWNANKLLMQIGIKGYEVAADQRPSANLVFLVDVSGSMQAENKLQLLKNSLKLLTRQLRSDDRVSLVVYAGSSGIVLEPTPGDQHAKISAALEQLTAGGRTNGAGGIRMAYQLAAQSYLPEGINRVLLATDGDFNVGTVDFEALVDLAERKRASGVSLTTLGFGTGNYNDHLMEQLADAGNGNYAYIDNLNEGRKVLVDELSSTLQTIAKDVKIQVEFNPATVAEYRLIGYENRMLRREDFNNDRIDAGEIGAGHTVTALYEVTLVDSNARLIDPLRYGDEQSAGKSRGGEMAFVRLRYKEPDQDTSQLLERPVFAREGRSIRDAGPELQFAASVAAFGQLLKGGDYLDGFDFARVAALAGPARGSDPHGYRSEFLNLVRLADSLEQQHRPQRQAVR